MPNRVVTVASTPSPPWRLSDAEAYAQMRQLSDLIVTRMALVDRASALTIRQDTLDTDGYDRSAIDARARHLADLLRRVLE